MKEIERKFLVKNADFKRDAKGVPYRQGYLVNAEDKVVRVRIAGDRGFLTIKSKNIGLTRSEYEYEIPLPEADELLNTLCERPLVEKIRYKIDYRGHLWEVDEFLGDNEGLVMAEVELEREDEAVECPDWVGAEVSGDARYYNSNLIKHPYRSWT